MLLYNFLYCHSERSRGIFGGHTKTQCRRPLDNLGVTVSLFLCLLLTACGFTPMHQNTGLSSNAIYAQIEIPVIPDRDGQYLRNLLIDRLYTKGHPDNPRYVLNIQPLQLDTTNLGIQKDATVTRRQIDIRTDMELIDRDHPNPVLIRTFRAVGGYDVLDAQYATQIKERRVIEQVLTEIADSIVNDINLYFKKARP